MANTRGFVCFFCLLRVTEFHYGGSGSGFLCGLGDVPFDGGFLDSDGEYIILLRDAHDDIL